MPSSGSTTSRSASSTSSCDGTGIVVTSVMCLSCSSRVGRGCDGRLHRHPAQQCALYACRVLRYSLERDRVVEGLGLVLGQAVLPLRLHQLEKLLLQGKRVRNRFANDQVAHDRG